MTCFLSEQERKENMIYLVIFFNKDLREKNKWYEFSLVKRVEGCRVIVVSESLR